MTDLVLSEVRSDGVATLRLNRPPMNTLSSALVTEIGDTALRFRDDPAIKAVVVLGSEKAFAAGADISEFGGQDAAREIGAALRRAFSTFGRIPRPVIAAIAGFALGGGLELALACDLRVMGERAKVGQPEILLGITPGAGGTQRLARLVGPARAKEIIWSGRQVGAAEALAMGIVDRVVPNDEVESAAIAWAAELASGAVVAMGLAKSAIDRGLDGSLEAGLDAEDAAFVDVFGTSDADVGVKSFLEHGPGKATFEGR